MKFPNYFPEIRWFNVVKEKDERLWYPYTIGNGKLYQIIEDQDTETWELYVTEVK